MAGFRKEISEWPLQDKFAEVLRRTAPKLPESMRHAFLALLSPASLALTAGAKPQSAAFHAPGVGEVVDIVLLIGAATCVGIAAFDAASGIKNFFAVTSSATNENDLDAAAEHLAGAIALAGVAALAAMLARLANSSSGKDANAKPVRGEPGSLREMPLNASAELLIGTGNRRYDNELLRRSPQFAEDMRKVGVTKYQITDMQKKRMPLGFDSRAQFRRFKQELDAALKSDGLWDAEIGLKGTATTFYSENPGKPLGHHWDADPRNLGDYDLNVTSNIMVGHMKAAGIRPSAKYGIFKTSDMEARYPGLDKFAQNWSDKLGRVVNFVGYPEPQQRDPTEFTLKDES